MDFILVFLLLAFPNIELNKHDLFETLLSYGGI